MIKVMLMTLSTGGGHNYAAVSLETKLREKGFDTVRVDPYREHDRLMDLVIARGYNTIARTSPGLYGQIYRLSDRGSSHDAFLKLIRRKSEKMILELIRTHRPDVIVSTHPILTYILGAARSEGKTQVPVMAVVTDFGGHYSYMAYHRWIDAYITGSAHTKRDLIRRGASENKVFAYGIPIREEFYNPPDESQRDGVFTVLLMGGSMGVKLMGRVMEELVKLPEYFRILAVCGNDTSLRESLDRRYAGRGDLFNKEITIYGFTSEVARLMDASNLMISKPGGLTVSEAIAKRMPMLIPYMIPGQEEENATLLDQEGAGLQLKDISEVAPTVSLLMKKPFLLSSMRSNMAALASTHSLEAVVEMAGRLASQPPEEKTDSSKTGVLICYGGFSRGNIESARALRDRFRLEGITAEAVDLIESMSPTMHRALKRYYMSMMRSADFLYDLVDGARKIRPNVLDQLGLRIYLPWFSRAVERYNPRMLISFHPPWSILGGQYKERRRPDMRLVVCHPEVPTHGKNIHRAVDTYLVPGPEVREALIRLGVSPGRVLEMDLPMGEQLDMHRSDCYLKSLVRDSSRPVAVFLGDEPGSVPESPVFYQWLEDSGWQAVVLTGDNRTLERSLESGDYKNVVGIRSVDQVSDLIGAADLLVGYPYYITALEAMVSRTPFAAYGPDDGKTGSADRYVIFRASGEKDLNLLMKRWLTEPEFRREKLTELDSTLQEYRQRWSEPEILENLLAGLKGQGD